MNIKSEATIEDLYSVPENCKAEIVNGELLLMSPTGFLPGRAGGEIYANLRDYKRLTKSGYALPDNVGFFVNLPNRRSLSPDAAFYTGKPTGGKFLNGAPVFATEAGSENDYGETAEKDMASKRRDYFAVGTLVVWDVDVLKEEVIRVYRASYPEQAQIYRRGEVAEAEPALPGWTMLVDNLFVSDRLIISIE
ncbi:Uma2 family endonuclease [Komarekiella sp. 'clone 1']|uniref:Uma2 family endonuclease n=1 Tax=Komarekiella delphini-convector SJRDD-AB1 TaxID=2593771 RepID=A0AA40SY47_9NOST|nr:Uma2 family endonuclease [Komarekiella delphini-convector]MBD6617453.1 Uma2 family endonuclease [Komarekiella delphini-convector SJRDD-AB1]